MVSCVFILQLDWGGSKAGHKQARNLQEALREGCLAQQVRVTGRVSEVRMFQNAHPRVPAGGFGFLKGQ